VCLRILRRADNIDLSRSQTQVPRPKDTKFFSMPYFKIINPKDGKIIEGGPEEIE